MKKFSKALCMILAVLMLVSVLAACKTNTSTTDPTDTTDPSVTQDPNADKIPPVPTKEEQLGGEDYVILMTCRNNDAVIVRDFLMSEADAASNVLNEALYKRNKQMEQEYDLVISPIVDYRSTQNSTDLITRANTSNEKMYDLCIIGTYSASTLAMNGDLVDLNNYGSLDLTNSWWDQNINRDLTVNGKVFFTTGDISLVPTQAMYGLVFNKDMFEEYDLEEPYQLVKEYKWTFDKLKEFSAKVSGDLDGDDVMGQFDLYGFGFINSTCMAFLNAAGERIAYVNDEGKFELGITSEKAASAVIDFVEFTKNKTYTFNGQKGTDGTSQTAIGMFADGQLLFRAVEHLGFPHLRDTELQYGILPLPLYEESQLSYYTPVGSWDGAYVCIPVSTANDEANSKIMERTAYISQQIVTPAYYTRTLEGKYVKDEDSYDMIALQIATRMYDPGYMFNFGGMQDAITQLSTTYSTNFSSMLKANLNKAETALNSTNESFSRVEAGEEQ